MTRLQLVVYEYDRGINLDLSNRAVKAVMSRGKHGSLRLDVVAMMDRDEAFAFYTLAGTPTVELNAGPLVLWRGRAEKIAAREGRLTIGALGKWRATSDLKNYTALWSDGSVKNWNALTDGDISTVKKSRMDMDNNNRLWIAARNGEAFVNTDRAAWGYLIPDRSSRNIVVIQFVYEFGSGSNVQYRLAARPADWSGSGTALFALNATGGVQTGARYLTFVGSPSPALTFELVITGAQTIAAATGSTAYMKITRLRVATTTANNVNTSYGSNITAGNRTITPVSMAGIYTGMELVITGSLGTSEVVVVVDKTSTTFDATFALTHTSNVLIQGIVVYGDEIVEDVLAAVNTLNPDQLSSTTHLIESPGVDMVDAVYLDRVGLNVIEDIAQRGDSAGNAWETGVYDDVLYLRPLGDDALIWAVDAEVSLERDVEQLGNQVRAVHKDATERLKRTSAAADLTSSERYGLTRQAAVDVHTVLAVEAETVRTVVLARKAEPAPRVSLDFDLIYSDTGSVAEKFLQNAGDEVVARNMPPTMDEAASFRLSRVDYDVMADGIKVEVESINLVNTLAGVGENTDRPVVNGQRKPFLIAGKG